MKKNLFWTSALVYLWKKTCLNIWFGLFMKTPVLNIWISLFILKNPVLNIWIGLYLWKNPVSNIWIGFSYSYYYSTAKHEIIQIKKLNEWNFFTQFLKSSSFCSRLLKEPRLRGYDPVGRGCGCVRSVCRRSDIPVAGRVNFWCMFPEVPGEGSQCW